MHKNIAFWTQFFFFHRICEMFSITHSTTHLHNQLFFTFFTIPTFEKVPTRMVSLNRKIKLLRTIHRARSKVNSQNKFQSVAPAKGGKAEFLVYLVLWWQCNKVEAVSSFFLLFYSPLFSFHFNRIFWLVSFFHPDLVGRISFLLFVQST